MKPPGASSSESSRQRQVETKALRGGRAFPSGALLAQVRTLTPARKPGAQASGQPSRRANDRRTRGDEVEGLRLRVAALEPDDGVAGQRVLRPEREPSHEGRLLEEATLDVRQRFAANPES